MPSELSMVGGKNLAAAAAITELVLLACLPCQHNLMQRKLVVLGAYGVAPYSAI